MTPIPTGWKPIESAPKDGTPVLLFARHIDAEASTRVVGWFNADYGWIAQSYIGQPFARLIPSQWAELLPLPGSPASVAPGDAQDERPPLFWYRPRSDDGYEGPIHNDRIEDVRKRSGAWVPLYPGFATLPKPLSDLRYHGEFIRGWNQCLREVSASVAAPAAGDALELLGALIEARRELHACQAVIHLAGGFDPAYVRDAQAALKRADAAIAAQQGKGGEA